MSENHVDESGVKSDPTPETKPRDETGKFLPQKPKSERTIDTPEPAKIENNTSVNTLLIEIETELKEALKGVVGLSDIVALESQDMRIRMMRILQKNVIKASPKEPINPLAPNPPTEIHTPTLLERNRADKYRADMRKQRSYIKMADKLRGKQT